MRMVSEMTFNPNILHMVLSVTKHNDSLSSGLYNNMHIGKFIIILINHVTKSDTCNAIVYEYLTTNAT